VISNQKLAAMIRNGLRRLKEEKKNIAFNKFVFQENGEDIVVNLKFKIVKPEELSEPVSVILFEPVQKLLEEEITYEGDVSDEFTRQRLEDLEKELKGAKQETQNVIEELETSNEELQSSNEELQASNEELQSTNEELQSVNEELYTINSELQVKNIELRDLNNDMNNLLGNTDIALLFLTKDLKIRFFTPELKRLFNLENNDTGRSINSFASNFINVSGKELAIDVQNVMTEQVPTTKEVISENNRHFLKRILPYKTIDNKIDGAVITFIDITEIRVKDLEMKLLTNRLEQAMDIGKLAWWSWDYKTGYVAYSDVKAKMLGFGPEELGHTYQVFTDRIHPDDFEHTMKAMKDHLEGKSEIYETEYRIKNKTGEYVWFYDKGGIVEWDPKGKPLFISGIVIGINERKKKDEEINKLFKAFLQSPTPNLITDKDGYIEFVNESHCKVTGYSAKEIIGQKTNIFKSGTHDTTYYQHLWQTITSKKVWEGEIANRKKNGDIYWEYATISPILNPEGEIVNYMKVSQDVSSRIIKQEKLKQDKILAEESDKLKSAFLANMSHEIRTPMNAIIGFSQLLEDIQLSDEQRKEFIRLISSQGEYLLTLINDIIDISKVEAGAIELRDEECNMKKLLHDLHMFFILNKMNDIKINVVMPDEGLLPEIYTDATRLRQILTNLIGNAVKFTPKGQVEFGVSLHNEKELLFYVKDTGLGIKKDKIDKIFDRFYQVYEGNSEYNKKGTGLGLAITKALVELLGGKLWVESEEFVGSVFYFTIPYRPAKIKAINYDIEPDEYDGIFNGHTILVVEDIESNYLFIMHALENTQAELIWAKNGIEAIEQIKKNESISLILMDISMPLVDGYEATRKIRQLRQHIPIIAQTAHAMEGDKQNALNAGCNDYISKPIKIEDLINKMNQFLSVLANQQVKDI
jgi:two-component system, chemotaxis family, CheB/CheR fusion protein